MHALKPNNRLPDGRRIRALEGTFNQKQMFDLYKSGLFDPATETIMNVIEHDQSIQFDAWKSVDVDGWWRTGDYAFYPRGVERKDIPLGEKLLYIEEGFSHILKIPDEPVTLPNGETIGLRQAVGMGVIKLEKLELIQIDEIVDEISVTTDFDPKTDVKVVDIPRRTSWAGVDPNGYPLRTEPSDGNNRKARYLCVRIYGGFEGASTGWHGSAARFGDYVSEREIEFSHVWKDTSGVAVVERKAAGSVVQSAEQPGATLARIEAGAALGDQGVLIKGSLEHFKALTDASTAEIEALLKTLDPEKLRATRQLLEMLDIQERVFFIIPWA